MKQGTHSNAWTSAIVVISLVFAALAPWNATLADDIHRVPYDDPEELTNWLIEESAFLTHSVVATPDGGVAIQASVRMHDPGPFGNYLLDKSVITFLDRSGNVTRRIKVPELEWTGANLVRAFANGHVLLERAYRRTGFLAEIDLRGAVVWQRVFNDRGYSGVASSTNLPDGGFAVIGAEGPTVDLYRLDKRGRDLWTRQIPQPEASGIFNWVYPVAVEGVDDDIIVICNFENEVFERSDGWMFRFDSQGNEIWQRSLRGYVSHAVPMADGTMVLFGFPHRVPEQPYRRYLSYNPYAGEVGDWALTRVSMNDGAIIRSDLNPLPMDWHDEYTQICGSDIAVLPDGGMMFNACRRIGGTEELDYHVFRFDSNHRVMPHETSSDLLEQDGQLANATMVAVLGSRLLVAGTRRDPATGTNIYGFYTLPVAGLADAAPYRKTDRR